MTDPAGAARLAVDDPLWIPDRIDAAIGTVTGVLADPERLRRASFLDGREAFGSPAPDAIPFAALVQASGLLPSRPVPTVFHVSFCRSTLLARLLDVPGATRVLREPRAQIDLADWLAARDGDAGADPRFLPVLGAVNALFGRQSPTGETTLVKPTNWSNPLIPSLLQLSAVRPIFITMAPRAFLRAVFRGGRDRIAFTMRTAQLFAAVLPGTRRDLAQAIALSPDPLDRAARLSLLALRLQRRLFGADPSRLIDEADLRADPVAVAVRAASLLGLPLTAAMVEAHAGGSLVGHAKAPDAGFSAAGEDAANREVEQHHGRRFDAALRWDAEVGAHAH